MDDWTINYLYFVRHNSGELKFGEKKEVKNKMPIESVKAPEPTLSPSIGVGPIEIYPIECTCWPINFGDGSVVTG